MKVIAIASSYVPAQTTLATALRVTRQDGEVFGFTSHDVDSPEISGVVYAANPGLEATNIEIAAGLAVGNLELTTLHDGTVFSTLDVLGDVWRNAEFLVFRYDYVTPLAGIDPILAGNFGEIEIKMNSVVIELRDLRQFLQQPIGDLSSKTCRARLGDERCTKDISAPPYTVPFTVTSVTSKRVFTDSGQSAPDDWFGEGEILWLTGNNAGQRRKVKTYGTQIFGLSMPMWSTIQVGDTGTAISGCRKRREEDCRDKYDNVLNMVAEPDRKGLNDLTAAPDPLASEDSGGGGFS